MVAAVLHLHEGARAAVDAVDQMRRGVLHRHDVADGDFSPRMVEAAPDCAIELFVVAEDAIDLGHVGEGLRLGLRRAAGDDDARSRLLAADLADGLARLAHGLGGHRAGVDDDVSQPGRRAARRITSDS